MLKKLFGRTAGVTAAAALVAAAGPVLVSSPAFAACDYPTPTATSTTLSLTRTIGQYGQTNTASVTVSSGSGTPSGTVRLSVDGRTYANLTLSGGHASRALPRTLAARTTHTIRATFLESCSASADYTSSSAAKSYTVYKSRTHVAVKVLKRKGAKFRAHVTAVGGLTVKSGKVGFKVLKKGHVVRTGAAKVRRGYAVVDLRNLKHGKYVVKAHYRGNRNYKVSTGSKRFAV